MSEGNEENDIIKGEMEPINVVPVQKDIKSLANSSFNDVEKILSQSINLNNENEIHEPTCPICSSKLRKKVEEMFDQGRINNKTENQILLEIVSFFNSSSSSKISKDNVRQHIYSHSGQAFRELQKVEYISKLQRLKSQNTTTLGKLDVYEAMLMERLMGINSLPNVSQNATPEEIERIKSSETARIMSQINNMLKLRATIMGEMRSSGEVISLPTKEFVKVFTDAITNSQNEREKEIILGLLDQLKKIGS